MDDGLLDFDALSKAECLADLIEFDGPFVSLFKATNESLWLRCWQYGFTEGPPEGRFNQWLWVQVSVDQAKAYLLENCTLRECFQKADKLAEEFRREKSVIWKTVQYDQLNASNLPDENSFCQALS